MTAIEAARPRALSYDSDKSPERIEEDIVQTRRHLEETLDEFERRLAPRQMIDSAKERLLSSLQGDSEQLFSALRENAIPVFLIAAGLAWLLLGRRREVPSSEPVAPEAVVEPIAAAAREPVATPIAPQHDAPEMAGARPTPEAPWYEAAPAVAEQSREPHPLELGPALPEVDRAAAGDKPTFTPAPPVAPGPPDPREEIFPPQDQASAR